MLVILTFSTGVFAQSNLPPMTQEPKELSKLEDYIKLAIDQNPGLLASYQTYQATLERAGYVGAIPDPVLSYGHFFNEVETRVGPQKEKFSIRQSFPWFGTLGIKSDIVRSQAEVAFEKYQYDMLALTFELKLNYFQLLNLEKKEAILQESKTLLAYWTGLIKTKYELGEKSHSDFIQAQIETALIDDELLSLQSQIEPVKAKLKAILNNDKLALATDDSFEIENLNLNEPVVIDSFILGNPNLAQYSAMIKVNEKNVDLASKASYPDVTFGLDYIVTDESPMAGIDDNGKDPLMVSVGINLPLWFGKNKAKKREAVASLKASEYAYQNKLNQLKAELEKEQAQFKNIKRKYLFYQNDIVPQSEYNLELLFKAYQLGENSVFDLLKVERELLNYQMKLEDMKTTALVSLAKIELLSNRNIF